MLLRTVPASLLALAFVIVAGCGSSDSDEDPAAAASGVCGEASAWKNKCAGGASECDETIIATCSDVTSLLNASLLDAAKTCVQQADCGTAPTSCFAQSIASATPTASHRKLAEGFCGCLPKGKDACVEAIDANDGPAKVALSVALPLSDDLADAITDTCTGSIGCSATFSACAQGVIAKKAAETLSADAAKCLAQSILEGAKEPTPEGDGGTSCTPKTCDDLDGACGEHDDGCGGTVSCGKCAPPACKPKTCEQLGKTCGTAPDGCGGTTNCGKCDTACTDPQEPNEEKTLAKGVGSLSDSPNGSNVIDGLTSGDGDEDWFVLLVKDEGFDGNPRVDVSATGNLEVSVFFFCDSGGDASYCPDGATQDNTYGKGCRALHDTVLSTSCSGITDSGQAFIRVRKTASDGTCTPYALTLSVE